MCIQAPNQRQRLDSTLRELVNIAPLQKHFKLVDMCMQLLRLPNPCWLPLLL